MAEFKMSFNIEHAEKEAVAIVYDFFQMRLAAKEGEIAIKLGIRSIRTEQELMILQAQHDRLKRTNDAMSKNRPRNQS